MSSDSRTHTPAAGLSPMDPMANDATRLKAVNTILDSLDALVYVADMETHELLFINDYGKAIWGADAAGQPCWQILQNKDSPCDFCTNNQLIQKNGESAGVHVWEFQNAVNGHWYQCRDQAIRWVDGRLVRMEIATDITDRKRLEEELEQARRDAERLSRTDELTGLPNRRAFFELSEAFFHQARRSGRPLAVAMVDVDYFKHINDNHGHLAGDQVLRQVAQAVEARVRKSDILGRFGGEEFVLTLPDTNREQALVLADRLRERIAETRIPLGDDVLSCTVSVGVAATTDATATLEKLLAQADTALFRAKVNGRNRVEGAS